MYRQTARVAQSFAEAIGQTPLIKVESLSRATGCTILAKAEWMNPGGSIKDRAALAIIDAAEKEGKLVRGSGQAIVEATAGNTGVALVHIANSRGYRCIFTCPESVSEEKITCLRVRGATVELCPLVPFTDPANFQRRAATIAEEEGGFFCNQFDNMANSEMHFNTTGPEIWAQQNDLTIFCTAPGTGGTLAGVSRYLKRQKPEVLCVMLDTPKAAVTISDEGGIRLRTEDEKTERKNALEDLGYSSDSILEGIGSGRLYLNLATSKIDHVVHVSDEASIQMARYVLKHDGLFGGGSTGTNLAGAALLAKLLGPGHTIVTVMPDSGERYMSKIFNDEFIKGLAAPYHICLEDQNDLGFLENCLKLNSHIEKK